MQRIISTYYIILRYVKCSSQYIHSIITLKSIFRNKKIEEKEKLLSFEFTIEKNGNIINVEIILTNPKDEDIENFLETGLKSIDTILPKYFNSEIGLKKIVLEYSNNSVKVNFGIRKDAVPIFPKE